jgi:hypothetical protein
MKDIKPSIPVFEGRAGPVPLLTAVSALRMFYGPYSLVRPEEQAPHPHNFFLSIKSERTLLALGVHLNWPRGFKPLKTKPHCNK